MKSKRQFRINQYIDGQLQHDPICGGRDGFATFRVPFGPAVNAIKDWLREHSTGLVCVSWTETTERDLKKNGGAGGYKTTYSPVLFEFENASEAIFAKPTFGGVTSING